MIHTRRLASIAMLAALSTLLAYPLFQFSLFPGAASFLKIEFTILPVLLGAFLFGLGSAFIILLLRSILWLLLFNQGPSTWIGLPMNVLALGIFVFVFWSFTKKSSSILRYLLGAICSTLSFTVLMFFANIVYAIPMYSAFANYDIGKFFPGGVSAYLFGAVLPFNIIEGFLFSIVFGLIFWFLKRSKALSFIKK